MAGTPGAGGTGGTGAATEIDAGAGSSASPSLYFGPESPSMATETDGAGGSGALTEAAEVAGATEPLSACPAKAGAARGGLGGALTARGVVV